MSARTLMVQGTGSSVGKSLLAAGLCRAFARSGLRVLPYKSQNMSNNAFALRGGGEIGRAQALQAAACGVEPRADMNPVLLKPEGDSRSQVLVLGRPEGSFRALDYRSRSAALWDCARGALDRLRAEADLVLIEGAGSPAEINLKVDEFANMRVARYAASPVLLVGDIDTGGVFAQFAGTLALLDEEERALVAGLVVNKFRGDPRLLEPGLRMIEGIVGKPVLGVLPWLSIPGLAEEDAAPLESRRGGIGGAGGGASGTPAEAGPVDVAAIRYPRLSNFDDLDALGLEPGVRVRFVARAEELGEPDAIVLPGSKATRADLAWLRAEGLDLGILWRARLGTPVLGICGGFQMMGGLVEDPEGLEGEPGSSPGLGLLRARTRLEAGKATRQRRGRLAAGTPFGRGSVEGYEIHAGRTRVEGPPLFDLEPGEGFGGEADGTWAEGGRLAGSYLHGLFDEPAFRRAWLDLVAPGRGFAAGVPAGSEASPAEGGTAGGPGSLRAAREAALEALADAVEAALDMDALRGIAGIGGKDGTR